MKVKVTLSLGANQPAQDIQIVADGSATVGHVADAIVGSAEMRGRWTPGQPPTLSVRQAPGQPARALPRETSILGAGIRSGAAVEVAHAAVDEARGRQAAVALLRVLSGPAAGSEVSLPFGSWSVGRASGNDVVLADPTVSSRHAKVVVGRQIEIVDQGSSNGVVLGGQRVQRARLTEGVVVELGDCEVTAIELRDLSEFDPVSVDVDFVRSPRLVSRPEAETTELPEAPGEPTPVRFPFIALVAPLVMAGAMILFFPARSSLLFVALSPILMLANYVDQKRQRRSERRRAVAEFDADMERADADLVDAHAQERTDLLRLFPSIDECVDAATRHTGLMWTRRPEHPEFLVVRAGLGRVEPRHVATLPRRLGEEQFAERLEALEARFETIPDAPVTVDLREGGGLGVIGPATPRLIVAGGFVAQAAVLHSPAELVVTCLTSTAGRERWRWLEWLPHTSSPHSPLGDRALASDAGTGRLLLDALEGLLAARYGDGPSGRGPRPRGPIDPDRGDSDAPVVPSVLVVVDEPAVDHARLARLAEAGPDVGVFVLWSVEGVTHLPAACRTWVEAAEGGTGRVVSVRRERDWADVATEGLTPERSSRLARLLAPLKDAGAPVDDVTDIPESVSMVALLGRAEVDEADRVVARWRENRSLVDRTPGATPEVQEKAMGLSAVVGSVGADAFTLDLRSQGPHALVGGTTGAGKSEFLQAWVLGLAHAYSPDRLTFLFVDYKGGSAFAECTELPHHVGMLTDLDEHQVFRALTSLKAELHHRERLLRRKRANDLVTLERRGDPECPPSLVIVIDEFAALKNEVPEFFDGVVDIAARGRSLGLHLIMATQRPGGVIDDNLRANTNLRVALRMADESNSSDVLGDGRAAHFPVSIPGRAAAKTGPGRITLFQSAYAGARTPDVEEVPPVDVAGLGFGDDRPWQTPRPAEVGDEVKPDITRLVRTLRAAAEKAGVPAPRRPWQAPLALVYSLGKLSPRTDERMPIGVVDLPDEQVQATEWFRPDEDGHLAIYGVGGTGKTSALRSIAVAAAVTPSSGLAHTYALDFAGGQLRAIEELPNVGSVVGGDDTERVARLLSMLVGVVEERRARFSAVSANRLDSYRRIAGRPLEPRIMLLLDGMAAFRGSYEDDPTRKRAWRQFQQLLAEGAAVGVHVVVTGDNPYAVPSAFSSSFRRRLVMRQARSDDYGTLGVPLDVLGPTSPAGRAIIAESGREMQLAVFVTGTAAEEGDASALAQATSIARLAGRLAKDDVERPAPVRRLPALLEDAALPPSDASGLVVGMADETLEALRVQPEGMMILAGPAGAGRTSALLRLAEELPAMRPRVRRVLLGTRASELADLDLWDAAADSEAGIEAVLDQVEAGSGPLAVFVENVTDLGPGALDMRLKALALTCRRRGDLFVGEAETSTWSSPGGSLVSELKQSRRGLLLCPESDDGNATVRTPLPPRLDRADFPPGRGFWIAPGRMTKVQVALPSGSVSGVSA